VCMARLSGKPRYLWFFWRFLERIFKFIDLLARFVGVKVAFQVFETSQRFDLPSPSFNKTSLLPKIGIVIQGPISNPIILNETLAIYRRNFPNSPISLSTWKDDQYLPSINVGNEISVIENTYPENPGISNLNFQAVSTVAGINSLKNSGCDFVLKTRTDQVLYNSRALDLIYDRFIKAQLKEFERILTTDFNSFLFRAYSPSDQLMFGKVETLSILWSSYMSSDSRKSSDDIEDFAERKLVRAYIGALGIPFENTLKQSLEIYRDLYAFIDNEELDLFWHKGTYRVLRSRFPQQYFPSLDSFVRYSDWLRLQSDLDFYLNAYESISNQVE